MTSKKIRILHLLSQRPDSTGSGIYIQAMLREAEASGHHNYLIAGLYHLPVTRIHVVGAGHNDRLFKPQEKPTPGPVQLVYAGKLSCAKGVPWFLRALSKIHALPWRLHLVGGGSGAERQACLRLADELGDRVKVHGAVNQQDLAAIMRQSHIFILPSFYEGLPLVVLEALGNFEKI
jgi:glycosyltransferase involved in cell wall biosynthesis